MALYLEISMVPQFFIAMNQREAIDILLEHVEEWHFEDNPRDNICYECSWNRRKDGVGDGLKHHPGCKLKEALDLLRNEENTNCCEHEKQIDKLKNKLNTILSKIDNFISEIRDI